MSELKSLAMQSLCSTCCARIIFSPIGCAEPQTKLDAMTLEVGGAIACPSSQLQPETVSERTIGAQTLPAASQESALFKELKGSAPFFLMAGPNVIQSEEHCLKMCRQIKEVTGAWGLGVTRGRLHCRCC